MEQLCQKRQNACIALLKQMNKIRRSLDSRHLKGPLKYLLVPLLGKNQLAITLHMYASIGQNLDNTHWGQI